MFDVLVICQGDLKQFSEILVYWRLVIHRILCNSEVIVWEHHQTNQGEINGGCKNVPKQKTASFYVDCCEKPFFFFEVYEWLKARKHVCRGLELDGKNSHHSLIDQLHTFLHVLWSPLVPMKIKNWSNVLVLLLTFVNLHCQKEPQLKSQKLFNLNIWVLGTFCPIKQGMQLDWLILGVQ